jgi:hypothetical protein
VFVVGCGFVIASPQTEGKYALNFWLGGFVWFLLVCVAFECVWSLGFEGDVRTLICGWGERFMGLVKCQFYVLCVV